MKDRGTIGKFNLVIKENCVKCLKLEYNSSNQWKNWAKEFVNQYFCEKKTKTFLPQKVFGKLAISDIKILSRYTFFLKLISIQLWLFICICFSYVIFCLLCDLKVESLKQKIIYHLLSKILKISFGHLV